MLFSVINDSSHTERSQGRLEKLGIIQVDDIQDFEIKSLDDLMSLVNVTGQLTIENYNIIL